VKRFISATWIAVSAFAYARDVARGMDADRLGLRHTSELQSECEHCRYTRSRFDWEKLRVDALRKARGG
jgi:hypothetical protein